MPPTGMGEGENKKEYRRTKGGLEENHLVSLARRVKIKPILGSDFISPFFPRKCIPHLTHFMTLRHVVTKKVPN